MFKIIISGEIGWEVMSYMIREKLSEAGGQDIEVDISSPGGSVFEGIEIFNMFREYKRENPNSEMILNIKSEAASMGSYLSSNEVFSLVTIEDNSTFMIHNPLMGVYGDYQEMEKGADFLKRLASMMSPVYAKRSGKSVKEIQSMMDSETWLFGEEIVKAGFADEIIKTDIVIDKSVAIAQSELKLKSVMQKVRDSQVKESDFERVAAIMQPQSQQSNQPATGGDNNTQEEITMKDSNELKEKFPTVHAETMKAGEQSGRESILANNKTLMEMKKSDEYKDIPEVLEVIDESIMLGRSVDATNPLIMAAMVKIMNDPKRASRMRADADSADDISMGEDKSISGEESGTEMSDVEMKKAESANREW